MNRRSFLESIPWATLLVGVACSGGTPETPVGGSGSAGSGSNTSTGASGSSAAAGTPSGVGGAGATSGDTSGSDSTSGVGGAGAASGTGSGASAAGVSTGSSGGTSSGPGSGSSSGAVGSGASSGAASGSGSGSPGSPLRHGPSPGCGKAPVGGVSGAFTGHNISIPACGAGPITPDCIAPSFAPGGVAAKTNAGEDFTKRDYSIELPANYNPSTPYPVFYGGGGCGGSPPQKGDGFGAGETGTIEVGLSYVSTCFADGGTSCAGSVANEPLCVNGPELPYFRAVLAQVESQFCVDLGNEFVGGYSSGGWEAMTLGCGAANLLRGFVSDEGGKREHRPPCTGPIAGLMVAGEADTVNPIGPLAMIDPNLDSFGSAPERDELLVRNGCVGTATAMYDSKYPDCMQYTGCPAAYPVVWCPLPGAGHNNSSDGNVNYSPGNVAGDPLMWKFLSTLPAAP